jgi:hypothetical protein
MFPHSDPEIELTRHHGYDEHVKEAAKLAKLALLPQGLHDQGTPQLWAGRQAVEKPEKLGRPSDR